MDQLPRLGKRGLICLLLFTCNYVVFVRRGFLFLWVLGMGYVSLLWHSLSLPYNYFDCAQRNDTGQDNLSQIRLQWITITYCVTCYALRVCRCIAILTMEQVVFVYILPGAGVIVIPTRHLSWCYVIRLKL